MGLAAPDHTVPYGTVLSRMLSQALRARLRSVCPSGTGWQTVRNGYLGARKQDFLAAKTSQTALNLDDMSRQQTALAVNCRLL